jgi:co-chaperonin GroES (HSP10)
MTKSNVSYIETHEEKEAKDLINQYLGFEPPHVCGYYMGVVLYIAEKAVKADGTESIIHRADAYQSRDRFTSCVGLVVYQGNQCYTDKKRFGEELTPWCKVGDWVVIPRHEGIQVNYRGKSVHLIPDDKVLAVIKDPMYVTRD